MEVKLIFPKLCKARRSEGPRLLWLIEVGRKCRGRWKTLSTINVQKGKQHRQDMLLIPTDKRPI